MIKVLVADDNPLTLRSIQRSLELAGFEVIGTSDPTAIVDLAAKHAVDVAVLDVVMPALSGFDVLHALRQRADTVAIPVVFLSGMGEGPDRVRGLREGADDYLVKPFEPAELALRLERVVARTRPAPHAAAPEAPPIEVEALDLARLEEHVREGRTLGNVSFGRYQIHGVLGEGATGTVFRGWDTRLQRAVALKTIRLSRAAIEAERVDLRRTLLREAVAAARFLHPNIVAIYDLQDTVDIAYIIMEFVNGMTLESYLTVGGGLPADQTIQIGCAIASALETAHANRVVHHDLKPGNVLLGRDGSIKVSDFGIAEFLSSMLGARDRVFGTPGFVPPECLTGGSYDERGDLFALGVTLYTCLSGIAPFAGETMDVTIRNTLELEPAPPRRIDSSCPRELDTMILALLAKERRQRPSSAAQVARDLGRLSQERGLGRWQPSMAVMESPKRARATHSLSMLLPTTEAHSLDRHRPDED